MLIKQRKFFKILFYVFLILNICINNAHQSPRDNDFLELDELKRQLYESILDDSSEELDDSNESQNKNENYYAQDSDYKKLSAKEITDDDILNIFNENMYYLENKPTIYKKQKRFIQSLFNKFKSKNKTSTPSVFDEFLDDIESEPFVFPTTTTKAMLTKFKSVIVATTTASNSGSASDDVFYKLKQHCSVNYDKLCATKKLELYELVKKCDMLKIENRGKTIEACRDVLSIYCYVFYDSFTCFGEDYSPYVPGRKQFSSGATTKQMSTASSRRIPIIIQTSAKVETTKPTTRSTTTTTTSKPTTKLIITTTQQTSKPTIKLITTTTKPTVKPGGSNNNNDLISPFDGPVTSIPNDAEKLQKIGNYCLKTKQKDGNCDKMLSLLKDKFKACEKKPKTDSDCQTFKMQFCSAFKNFPCCPDVLAGRTCQGKNNSRRNFLNM